MLLILAMAYSSSSFQMDPYTCQYSGGTFTRKRIAPFGSPSIRNLSKLSKFTIKNRRRNFLPRTTIRLHSSRFAITNTTDADPMMDELSYFEQDAMEQIGNLELLFEDSTLVRQSELEKATAKLEVIAALSIDPPQSEVFPLLETENVEEATTSQNKEMSITVNPLEDDHDKDVKFARLLLLGAAALYGTNFALVKILNESVPVGASTSLRFGLASLATLPWLFPSKSKSEGTDSLDILATPNSDYIWGATFAGFEVGLWNSIGYIAQAVGLETVDASKSAFICSLAVMIVPILDALTGKKLSSRKIFGMLMAVSGVALLELGGPLLSPGSGYALPSLSSGDLISFIQPLTFGIGFWRMEHFTQKFPDAASRLTASQLLSVAFVSITYCACGGGGVAPPSIDQVMEWLSNIDILAALAWTGIITTALTIYMETVALKTISAAEATLIFSTEPIWGSAFATAIVGEHLGIEAGLGAAMILGGCFFSTFEKKKNDSVNNEKKTI